MADEDPKTMTLSRATERSEWAAEIARADERSRRPPREPTASVGVAQAKTVGVWLGVLGVILGAGWGAGTMMSSAEVARMREDNAATIERYEDQLEQQRVSFRNVFTELKTLTDERVADLRAVCGGD